VKSWRDVKKEVEKAMEDIFGGWELKRLLKFGPFVNWNMEDNLCLREWRCVYQTFAKEIIIKKKVCV